MHRCQRSSCNSFRASSLAHMAKHRPIRAASDFRLRASGPHAGEFLVIAKGGFQALDGPGRSRTTTGAAHAHNPRTSYRRIGKELSAIDATPCCAVIPIPRWWSRLGNAGSHNAPEISSNRIRHDAPRTQCPGESSISLSFATKSNRGDPPNLPRLGVALVVRFVCLVFRHCSCRLA